MKQLATLALLVNMYDLPHDPTKVVLEVCRETCVNIVVPKADLEKPDLIERLANIIESQQK